jgi:diguanylate cyclase (GGDEF)-like protein
MKVLDEWVSGKKNFVLIFIDMDMLKYVNDVFGHHEGDVYINAVADLLRDVSPSAIVCRLGGDEFMVILRESDVRGRDMTALFEGLREKLVASSILQENGEVMYPRSMSFGIVEVDATNKLPASELLSSADERMYEYKKAHKKERRV